MAIAISVPVAALASTTDGSSYATGSFTPAANSLLVVFSAVSATFTDPPTISGGGLTWTYRLASSLSYGSAGGDSFYVHTAQVGASPSAMTVTCNVGGDAGTGAVVGVLQVTGHDTASPIVQMKSDTSSAAANPAFSGLTATNTNNGYIIALGNSSNPANATPPTGWTEAWDTGYATPTEGGWCGYRAGGEAAKTSFTVTCAAQPQVWAGVFMEIKAAASSGITGTSTVTLAGVTGSASGSVADTGASTATLDAVSGNATGAVADGGTSSSTLAAVGGGGAGSVPVAGASTSTLGSVSGAGAGTVATGGSSAEVLGAVGGSGAGAAAVAGAGAAQLADVGGGGQAGATVAGASAEALDAVGGGGAGAAVVSGASTTTLDAIGGSAEGGSPAIVGDSAVTLGAVGGSAAGAAAVSGAAAGALDEVVGSGAAAARVTGTSTQAIGAIGGSAAGAVTGEGTTPPPVVGEPLSESRGAHCKESSTTRTVARQTGPAIGIPVPFRSRTP